MIKFKKHPVALVTMYYLLIVCVSTVLLKSPLLLAESQSISWIDSFFTASSALTSTGLQVVDYTITFNFLGWLFLIFLFNIGAVGIIVVNTIIIYLIGRKIGYRQRNLAKIDINQRSEDSIVTIIKKIVKYFLIIELIGFILIFIRVGYAYDTLIDRVMNSLFLSASAITSSGFFDVSIFIDDFVVQWILIILMVFSFIGYPVIIDGVEFVKAKFRKEKFKFSYFTKIVVTANLITVAICFGLFFLLEFNNSLSGYTLIEQVQYSIFIAVTSKNMGLNIFSDITIWSSATLIIISAFMLIGGAPSSAAGGFRVTSLYIIYSYIKNFILGNSQTLAYDFAISDKNVLAAYLIITFYLLLAIVFTIITILLNPTVEPIYAWFETVSALTMTGLTTGITGELTDLTLLYYSLLMLVGRIGIVTLIKLIYPNKRKHSSVEYIEKEIVI